MPDISDPDRCDFVLTCIRPAASFLCQAYNSMKARKQQWDGLGGSSDAFAAMNAPPYPVRTTSNFLVSMSGVYDSAFTIEQIWNLRGAAAWIPDDASIL